MFDDQHDSLVLVSSSVWLAKQLACELRFFQKQVLFLHASSVLQGNLCSVDGVPIGIRAAGARPGSLSTPAWCAGTWGLCFRIGSFGFTALLSRGLLVGVTVTWIVQCMVLTHHLRKIRPVRLSYREDVSR